MSSQYPSSPGPYQPQPGEGRGGPPSGAGRYEVPPMGNRSASNPVGRAALAMAVLTCVFQVFGQAVLFVLLGPGNLGGAFAIVGWIGMGGTLCAVVAMVLGIVGLNKPGAAKGAAGVGLGVGAYVVLTSVVQMLSNMILTYA